MKTKNHLLKKSAIPIFSLVLFLGLSYQASANSITVSSSTNWSSITTGSGTSGIPAASDNILINSGATLTIDISNAVCASIQVGDGSTVTNGTLTFASSGSPALTVSGSITVAPNGVTGTVTMVSGAKLCAAGMLYAGGTATENLNAGNIVYTGTFTVPPTCSNTYNNLTIAGGTMSFIGNMVVNGTLTVNAGATLQPIPYSTTISGGGLQGNGTIYINHTGSTNDLTTQYTIGIATYGLHMIFNGTASQAINGTLSTRDVEVASSNILYLNGTLATSDSLYINGSGSIVTPGATNTITSGEMSGSGRIDVTHTGSATNDYAAQYIITTPTLTNLTINFAGGAAQKVATAITCANIIITNTAAAVSFNANISVSGTLTVNANAILIPGASNTIGGAGTLTGTGEIQVTTTGIDYTNQYTITNKTLSNLTVEFAGISSQNMNSAISPLGFIITNTSGVTFNATETPGINGTIVNGLLTVAWSYTLGGVVSGTGTIKVIHTGSLTNDLTAQYTGTLTLTNLTINYAGAGSQTINAVINPLGIIISGQSLYFNTVNQTSIGANGIIINANKQISVAAGNTVSAAITGNGTLQVSHTGAVNDITAQYTGTLTTTGLNILFVSNSQNINTPLSCREIEIMNGTTLNVNANISVSDSIYVYGFISVLVPGATNTIGGTGTLLGNGVIKVTASGNANDFASQYTIATQNLNSLNVTFAGTSAQVINTVISPLGFVISNSSGVSFNASETPGSSGTALNSSAILTVGATYTLSGSLGGNGTIVVTHTGGLNDLTSQYTGTLTLSSITVNFSGLAAQAINTIISPYNFIISNNTGVTFNATETPGFSGTTVNGTLIIGSAYTLGGNILGTNGTIVVTHTGSATNDLTAQYKGSLTLSGLTVNFNGASAQNLNTSNSPLGFVITNTNCVYFNTSQTPGTGGTVVNGKLIPINTATLSGPLSGSGTIKVTHTGSGTNDLTAQYTGTLTLSNLTVDFAGSMQGQLLNTAISPNGIIISNTGASVSFTTVSQTSIGSNGIFVNANAILLVSTGLTVSCALTGNGTIQVNHIGSSNDLKAQYTGTLTTNGLYIIFNGITSQFINSALACRGIQLNYWLNTNANINVTDSIWIKTSNSELIPGATNTVTAGQMFGPGIFEITHTGSTTDDYAAQYFVTLPTFTNLSVTFAGSGNQVLGTAISCNSIILGNSVTSTITVNANISVSNSLNIYTLNTLSPNPSITIGGTGQLLGSGEADVTTAGNTNDLTTQYTISTYNFTYTTIGFSGTAAQSVNASFSPSKISIKNTTATVTFNASLAANNGTTVYSGAMLVLGAANTLGGPLSGNGSIRVTHTGGTNDLTAQYTGSLTLSGITIDFDGSASQTLNTSILPIGFTITNTIAPVTFNANISATINGTTVNSGAILIVGPLNTLGGAVKGNGTIQVSHTGSATNDLIAQYTGALTLTNLAVSFNGISAQNLNTVISPLGFIISNTAGASFNANETPGIYGTIVNAGGLLIVGSGYTLSGPLTGNGSVQVTHTGGVNDLTAQYTGVLTLTNLTINFSGLSAQKSGTLSCSGLTLNNNAGLTICGNTVINNTLTLSHGIITLGANKLSLASGGNITGYNSSNYIKTNSTGVLEMQASNSGGTLFPVGDGYNPITIIPTTNAVFDVSLSNGITSKSGVVATSHAVGITWTVQLVSGSQNVTVTPQWNGIDELSLFDRTKAWVVTRNDQTSNAIDAQWMPSSAAATSLGADPYSLISGNIIMSSVNPTFIGLSDNNSASPLPVNLTTFVAEYQDAHVNLSWTTASEINNNYFSIERSADANNWTTIGNVQGHGTSDVINFYDAVDNLADVIPNGVFYYRLKQVDFNGSFQYSWIRSVDISDQNSSIMAYPNPAKEILNVNLKSLSNDNMIIQLVDMNGVIAFQEHISAGTILRQINISGLSCGIYSLQLMSGNTKLANQMVVKN